MSLRTQSELFRDGQLRALYAYLANSCTANSQSVSRQRVGLNRATFIGFNPFKGGKLSL